MILPGETLGVLGGGQLGRMFAVAARTMGYRVVVLDPKPDSPAAALADAHIQADYDDDHALDRLARACAGVTAEFENVPAPSLRWLGERCRICPKDHAFEVAQDRILEKRFLQSNGLATAPFRGVHEPDAMAGGLAAVGVPARLKRATFGYDGKGQHRVTTVAEAEAAFTAMGQAPCVLEGQVDLAQEISVVLARDVHGRSTSYPVVENIHQGGILDVSIAPARVPEEVAARARSAAQQVAEGLDHCGVLAVEFFLTSEHELLVNEIAPRPHNSGHYTLDACVTSQFEQQVRTLCGLALGETRLLTPAVMVNLLGDLWDAGAPPWGRLLEHGDAKLHLYGKSEARPGRKMGHYCCLGADADGALREAEAIRQALRSP